MNKMMTLKEWQREKVLQFKAYLKNGVWSQREYDHEISKVFNPPDWFKEQFREVQQ